MKFIYGILWAVGVAIVVFIIGALLKVIEPVVMLGSVLQTYAWLIGLASGIFYVVGTGRWFNR